MHSTIFQITTEKVEKGDYLNEDTLLQGDNSDLDYCSDISSGAIKILPLLLKY